MERTLEQIIEDRKARPFDDRLKTVQGSIRFDIDGGRSYHFDIDHGMVTFREQAGPADCVIACSRDDIVRIVNGQQNMLIAYMQGRVRIEGNLALAKVFHGLMPASPQASRGEASR